MSTLIQIRRDSSTNWNIVNPIVNSGELVYEQDTQLIKIGDGVTPYNSLSYLSSSASGLVGSINAQVTEWSPTLAQLTASYPVGTAQGVLSYVTDTNSVRIGNGQTIGSVPVGIRYWTNISASTTNGSVAGELATLNDPTITSSGSMVYVSAYPSNNVSSWLPLLKLNNGVSWNNYNILQGNQYVNNYNPLIYLDWGAMGSGSTNNYPSPAENIGFRAIQPIALNIIFGSSGKSVGTSSMVGIGGNGGVTNNIIRCTGGNGGNANDTASWGGNGGVLSQTILFAAGNGGVGANGGKGGVGGGVQQNQWVGGNGGTGTNSGSVGGNGGDAGRIINGGGNGASVADGTTGASGGVGGYWLAYGGNASASVAGGAAGTLTLSANGIYAGGSLTTQATSFRNGGNIQSISDTFIPSTLFTVMAITGSVNTNLETNFWTASNVKSFSTNTDLIPNHVIDHAGRSLRVKAQGYLYTDGTDSLEVKLYLGQTTLFDSTMLPTQDVLNSQLWEFEGNYVFLNTLTTGSMQGQGKFTYYTSPSSSVTWTNVNTSSLVYYPSIDNEIRLTSTWGTASVNNGILITNGTATLEN